MNAVRNLDGVRIEGSRIKVSFAKYGRDDKPYYNSMTVEADDEAKSAGGCDRYTIHTNDGRSFKEVVEVLLKSSKGDRLRTENNRVVVTSSTEGHEDVLNEKLVELKYEPYQEVYYIDKAVTRITIK